MSDVASCLVGVVAMVVVRGSPIVMKESVRARCVISRDENGTEIFRIDRFGFLYYEPFFNIKNCQFQSVSQPFSTIFCTL
jgi:hypothetical protein